MRRPNGGVIWLLLSGVAMAFAFNQIVSWFLALQYYIPSFIILVLSGYITARVIGRVGGEFSTGAKSYSILLEGFMFGMAFDLMRIRYDWFINIFKYIAIGSFFILIAMVYKRNLEKYAEQSPKDGPHLGLMRLPILYIIAGASFGLVICSIVEAFLNSLFFIALLPFLLLVSIFVMITAKANNDLLDSQSGVWQQLLAGGMLGITYDLLLFRVLVWQDLLKAFIIFAIFVITASVVRMKEATIIKSEGIRLDFDSKKTTKPKKVVGSIDLQKRTSSSSTRSKTSSKTKSSSQRRK
ncbi:MAG TPA: hypothetical protein VMZ29_07955 [Candidatus Bathyarchaeia archaeon]|nr:hypothetical protein [Candidatus Bathyarchaeia archaeon]